MTNELAINENSVTYSVGDVDFVDYEKIKESAIRLADRVKTVEVTPDNVKESKRLRAAINKQIKALNSKRTEIKKDLLSPYEVFNRQVKEISDLVGEANGVIDKQISDLELAEKNDKKEALSKLYHLHSAVYNGFPVSFEQFITDNTQLLNKGTTMDKAEEAISQFVHQKHDEMETIGAMEDSADIMAEYLVNGYVLTTAIQTVKRRKEAVAALQSAKEATTPAEPEPKQPEQYRFTVFDVKDAKLVSVLLESNDIKFKKEVIK